MSKMIPFAFSSFGKTAWKSASTMRSRSRYQIPGLISATLSGRSDSQKTKPAKAPPLWRGGGNSLFDPVQRFFRRQTVYLEDNIACFQVAGAGGRHTGDDQLFLDPTPEKGRH